MAALITYSQTTDSQSDRYTNQKQYIDSLATNVSVAMPDDFRTPFTYNQWLQRNVGIIPEQEYYQYNKYLKDWHKNTYTVSDTINQIKSDYYALLQEINLTVTNPDDIEWLSELDISNDLDLEEAIPLFTKRLKELAIYFINKRDAIKKAKLKYNMVGSRNALEKLFYEHILKAFTQRDYVLNVPEQSAYDTFPELSAVKDGFQIYIEELYDDTQYFDKDPMVSVSTYYNLTNADLTNYLETKNIDTSDIEWLFGSGISDVYADNPLLWTLSGILDLYGVSGTNEMPLSAFSAFDNVLLNDYVRMQQSRKYLGDTQYVLSGGYYLLKTNDFEYPFISGNNWFYWPSGEYFLEAPDTYYDAIPLTATNLILDGAIAASSYELADKIFVEQDGNIKGAWLYLDKISNVDQIMRASILPYSDYTNGKGFQFRIPFSDYGLSAEDISYTNPGIDNVGSLYNILSPAMKRSVQDAYWNFNYSVSSMQPIYLNSTNLVDNGAHAANYYNEADKIYVRRAFDLDKIHDLQPNAVYTDGFERSWLYKFDITDLPIPVGQTYINWPVHTYEKESSSLAYSVPSSECIPIALSTVNVEDVIVGARAGYGIVDSDIIYKLDAWNGYPVECAFLSGVDIQTLAGVDSTLMYNASGKIQPSFTLRCRPGREERFVWHDSATYIDETTIVHHGHQLDCPYRLNSHKSILATKDIGIQELGTNGIGSWNDCVCRAIKYSPLGHPGTKFSDYNSMTDFIFVDTQFPNKFDITTWRGTDLSAYDSSKDFAWFQLVSGNSIEPDVGWGPGEWVTGDGSRFQLKPGVVYNYVRANLKRNPGELILDVVPDIIIKQKHYNTPPAKWMKAELNSDGNWDKTYSESDMILNPGDYLMYDHIDSNWYCLSTAGDYGPIPDNIDIIEARQSTKWASFDYVTPPKTVEYTWPDAAYDGGPDNVASELTAVSWMVTYPGGGGNSVTRIDPSNSFTFAVEQTGVYTVSAIGYGEFGSEFVSIVPNLSAVNGILVTGVSGELGIETTYNDRINMTFNIPLTGWDYNTNSFNGVSGGGRPIWAKAHDEYNISTKYKGVRDWGGGIRFPIDDYTQVLQPEVSEMQFELGDFVEYRYLGSVELLWSQPFVLNTDIVTMQWSDLLIDPQVTSPLSSFLYNMDKELVISATKNVSDIIIDQKCDQTTFINYYANQVFTWTQRLTDTSLGVPPDGGIWVDAETEVIINPIAPYANLSNRHFPTIATVPYIVNLFSDADSGGFFIPKHLGTGTYQSKQFTTDFDTVNSDSVVYRNTDVYSKDYGFTESYQKSPIEITDTNSNWMKSGVTTSARAGFVNNVKTNQTFMPYQSKFESIQSGNIGIRHITDDYTPWNGERNNTWIDEETFPPDFRGQYPIIQWYNQFPLLGDFNMVVWKTDIFGNNYALFKVRDIETQYLERETSGELWIRNSLGVVGTANDILEDVYRNMIPTSVLYNDLTSNNIINFDVIYDVIFIQTPNYMAIEKLKFDYDTGRIFSIADDLITIDLSGRNLAGYWLHENTNVVTIGELRFDNDIITPVIYTYDINSGTIVTDLYDSEDLSSYSISAWDNSIYSYNSSLNMHNITLIGQGLSGMNILIFNIINNNVDSYLIQPVNSYVGAEIENTESRNLINVNALNDGNLILTFEGIVTKNIYTCLIKDLNA